MSGNEFLGGETLKKDKEIEVTPEMIEAGVDALCRHDASHLAEPVVRDVYRAMVILKPPHGDCAGTSG